MKVTINRKSFQAAYSAAAAVVAVNHHLESYRYVLFSAEAKESFLLAADGEQFIRVPVVGCEVETPSHAGICMLPLAFGEILKLSPDETLSLAMDPSSGTLVVLGKSSEYKLLTVHHENFQTQTIQEIGGYHHVDAAAFREILKRALVAASKEDTPSYSALKGVLVDAAEGKLISAVGTDGRRMVIANMAATSVNNHRPDGKAIPRGAVATIISLLSGLEDGAMVKLSLDANSVAIQSETFHFVARLLEGRFPAYKKLLAEIPQHAAKVQVRPLRSAVKMAGLAYSKDESRGTDFTFKAGQLLLDAKSGMLGQALVEVDVEYEGANIDIRLDNRYLKEALDTLPEEQKIEFQVTDGDSAAHLSADNYRYLVMPLSAEK